MRASADKRSIDDEAAIEEARRRLRPLFHHKITDTSSPKEKFTAASALVEGALDEAGWALNAAEYALNEAVKCRLNKKATDAIADAIPSTTDAIPFIKLSRRIAIPVIKRGQPAKGRRGHHSDLDSSRNQLIAETVESISQHHGLSQEQASWVVSRALRDLWAEHRQAFSRLIEERGADPAWIEVCLMFIDKLKLGEDRIEDIAKKYRT